MGRHAVPCRCQPSTEPHSQERWQPCTWTIWLSTIAVRGPVLGIAFAAEAKHSNARPMTGIEGHAEYVMRVSPNENEDV